MRGLPGGRWSVPAAEVVMARAREPASKRGDFMIATGSSGLRILLAPVNVCCRGINSGDR